VWFRAGIWELRGQRKGVKWKDSPNLGQTEFHSHISLGPEMETAMSEREICMSFKRHGRYVFFPWRNSANWATSSALSRLHDDTQT